MKCKDDATIFHIEDDEYGVAMMLRGTTDSSFTLVRGVPSNDLKRIDEYLWADVLKEGKPVTLTLQGDNPIKIAVPGTYKFVNNGTEDEAALIDVTTYNIKGCSHE